MSGGPPRTSQDEGSGARRPTRVVPDRRAVVLLGCVLGLGTLAAGGAVWARAATSSAVEAHVDLAVAGGDVAPGVAAGGLVVLTSALALVLAGPWLRRAAAALLALGGLLVVTSAVAGLRSVARAARAAAQDAVGVPELDGPVTVTAMPWVTAALGVLVVVLGAWAVVVAGRWGAATARHDAPGRRGVGTASVGTSVGTSGAAPGPARASVEPSADGPALDGDDPDLHATWDALSRGEDPT